MFRFRFNVVGRDYLVWGRRRDGKGSFIVFFIMNVIGLDEVDKLVFIVIVNKLRKVGLKL